MSLHSAFAQGFVNRVLQRCTACLDYKWHNVCTSKTTTVRVISIFINYFIRPKRSHIELYENRKTPSRKMRKVKIDMRLLLVERLLPNMNGLSFNPMLQFILSFLWPSKNYPTCLHTHRWKTER